MKPQRKSAVFQSLLAVICTVVLVPGDTLAYMQSPTASAGSQASKIPPDQLDFLVAPIALYPDSMLAQVLAASTYPLEIIQLQQWQEKNKNLKDKALADAVAKQPWALIFPSSSLSSLSLHHARENERAFLPTAFSGLG